MRQGLLAKYLLLLFCTFSSLGLSYPSHAAPASLIPITALPNTFNATTSANGLTVTFELPTEISPSQGKDAGWGAIPLIQDKEDTIIAYWEQGRNFSDIWSLTTNQVGNRATFTIKFKYNATYEVIFWSQVSSNFITYNHKIVVTGASDIPRAPELQVEISYISSKTQAIVNVRRGASSNGCLALMSSETYLSLRGPKKSLSEYYTQGNPAYKYCKIDFDSKGVASFPIDATEYYKNGNELYLGYFFYPEYQNPLIGAIQGPQAFRGSKLQLTFAPPEFSHNLYCEDLYREKVSKCSLYVTPENALVEILKGKPVTTNIAIKKTSGNEIVAVSGIYGTWSTFYIGPDSAEQSLSIKYDAKPTYTYTARPYMYSAKEKIGTEWKLACNLIKGVTKCSVSNFSTAKYGFDLPATIPFEVTTRIWKSGETISDSTSFGRAMAPNSKFDFQIPVPKNSQIEEIQIGDGVTPDFANWINDDFDRPMTIENSVISLDCPDSFKGNSVRCALEYGTLSNYTKSLRISLEARNTKSGWRSVKKVSVTPNKLIEVNIPSIIDTTLQMRAVAVISGEKLYSEISKWQTGSSATTSNPSLEGAIKNAMSKQCQKLPAGFSKYSVQYSKQITSSDGVPGSIYIINKRTYIQIYNMGGWYMGPSNAISDRKTWSTWGCGGGIWIY
jgi:hypothetical protein